MNAKEKTCCFAGNRMVKEEELEEVKAKIKQEMIKLIEKGVCSFVCSANLSFETAAALATIELREIYEEIKLMIVLPSEGQDKYWKEEDKEVLKNILHSANGIVYIYHDYIFKAMFKRDRCMVNMSQYCICYLKKSIGSTCYAAKYAKKKKIKVIYI